MSYDLVSALHRDVQNIRDGYLIMRAWDLVPGDVVVVQRWQEFGVEGSFEEALLVSARHNYPSTIELKFLTESLRLSLSIREDMSLVLTKRVPQ
jgi:hypothetical protein